MKVLSVEKIFELYNRKVDVVRCPYGRAFTRNQLDSYAMAAVNLYGIISCKDFVEIFNKQNIEKTTEEEIYIFLLPLVFKNRWYCFYKEYIVHYWFFDHFDQADYLLKHQEGKPRYIPKKDEFLKYASEEYEDNDHWWNVRRFMFNTFGYNNNTLEGYVEIRSYSIYGDGIRELGLILDRHNFVFDGEKQMQEFITLIMDAKNNTRIWENNGHKPFELLDVVGKSNVDDIKFPSTQKQISRKAPCPCGSGKKYKNCCGVISDAKSAQLSVDECRLFYEIWYGLMGFINERMGIIKAKIRPEYPNSVSDVEMYKIREVLWKNPELIDEYINGTELTQERIDILKLWKTKHKKGMFLIMEYQPNYAVAIAPNNEGEDRLYGIKGISNSVANVLRRNLPINVETVLLPFKGKIIYDSFINLMEIGFGEGAKSTFREIYDKAIKHGIIESFE